VGVDKGGTNEGVDRGGIRRSGCHVSRQDQSVNGAENAACATSHRRVDVPWVKVDGDRVVHGRLGAGRWGIKSRGRVPFATAVDKGRVGEVSRVHRRVWVSGSGGSSSPTTVVDEGKVGEAGHTCLRCRAWRVRGREGRAWAQAGSTWPRVAQLEARAVVSRPCVAWAMAQDDATRVEGEPDRTQGECRDRWVGRSQQGKTHLYRKPRDERWGCGGR
jgi:hypothetical protein